MIIKNLKQLKKLAKKTEGIEVKINLKGGIYSRKLIYYLDNFWSIFSFIDNTHCIYKTDKELNKKTNIVKAIRKNALTYCGKGKNE